MLILDSGGLLAALDAEQNDHDAFAAVLTSYRGSLVISPFVVAELDYMILRAYGREDQLAFLQEIDRAPIAWSDSTSRASPVRRSLSRNTITSRPSE